MATQANDRDPIAPSDDELTELGKLADLLLRRPDGRRPLAGVPERPRA